MNGTALAAGDFPIHFISFRRCPKINSRLNVLLLENSIVPEFCGSFLGKCRTICSLFENISKFPVLILIVLTTVFGAILTGRQSGQKLQSLYGNPMANKFFQNWILRNLWIATLNYWAEDCIQQDWRMQVG